MAALAAERAVRRHLALDAAAHGLALADDLEVQPQTVGQLAVY
jgi:hypothetical protein